MALKAKGNSPSFFNRTEAAKEVGVKPTTLKHWEREIKYIDKRIKRSLNGGKRLYSRENIQQFLEVKRLLEEERLSVEEVAQYFKQGGALKDKQAQKELSAIEKKTEAQMMIKEAITKLEKLKDLL